MDTYLKFAPNYNVPGIYTASFSTKYIFFIEINLMFLHEIQIFIFEAVLFMVLLLILDIFYDSRKAMIGACKTSKSFLPFKFAARPEFFIY